MSPRIFVIACLCLTPAPVLAQANKSAMGFSLDVTLSPRAAAKLAAMKEKIEAAVLWYGDPTPASRKHADEMGQIDLGTEKIRLPGAGGRGEISGRSVKVNQIGWVKDRAVKVNLNVYSARLGGPDNVLDCDLFDDVVTKARAGIVRVGCKLIGEK